jgi:hypothetical protein
VINVWQLAVVSAGVVLGVHQIGSTELPGFRCEMRQLGAAAARVRGASTWRCATRSVTAMDKDHVKSRLHDAMHRGSHKATEDELAEVAAVVLAIVGEVTLELAAVIADLATRVEALEAKT